jgi:hypothetical protein
MRWFGKVLSVIVHVVVALAFLIFFAIVFAEWMAGCGETYVDSKGRRHSHECLFMNHPKK